MLVRIQHFFATPVFEDEEKTRVVRLLTTVLLSLMVVAALMLAFTLIFYGLPTNSEEAFTPLASISMLVIAIGLRILAHRGHSQTASAVLLFLIWLIITYWLYSFAQTNDNSTNIIYVLTIVLAGLLLGRRAAIFFTALSMVAALGAFYLRMSNSDLDIALFDLTVTLLVTGLIGLLLGHAVNNTASALRLARYNERALAERNREMEASQRVTAAASERVSPDDLMGLVVDLIRDQFNLYHVQVYLVEEEQRAAVLRESTGYAGQQLLQDKHHILLDHPALVTQAINEGRSVLVLDVSQEPSFMPNPLLPETQSELVVPLRTGDRVIGVLDVQDRTVNRFDEHTVTLFQTMADQITFLFENSELLEQVSEQTEALTLSAKQLRTAADIARQLSAILDPEHLLQQVVELIQNRFGLYHAHIYLLDEATGQMTVHAGSGEVGRVLRERGHSIPLDKKKSLVTRAAREREPVLVNDTSLAPDFMPNPLLPQTRSEAAVPLLAGDRVLGVLDVQDDQPGRFTPTDLDTLSTLAGQTATALQNASLFEQVEQNLAESRARFEISQALAGAQTEEEVLDAIIWQAGLYPKTQVLIFTNDLDADVREASTEPATRLRQSVRLSAHAEGSVGPSVESAQPKGPQSNEDSTVVVRRSESFESGIPDIVQAGMRFPASQFQMMRDIEPNSIFVSPNLARDERADPATRQLASQTFVSLSRTMGTTSIAILPLMAGNEHIGNIVAFSKQEAYFDESKLTRYKTIAEQGAAALHAARLRDGLRESEEKWRSLAENAPDIIMTVDRHGTILFINHPLPGMSQEQTIGGSAYDFAAPQYRDTMRESIERVFQTGEPDSYELAGVGPNNGTVWYEGRVGPIKHGGQVVAATVISTDVTERIRAEEERVRFTTQLRTAADLAEQINTILDPDQLLPEVVTQLQDRFDLYHVHIYLLDVREASTEPATSSVESAQPEGPQLNDEPTGELVMQAGSGEVGRILFEQGHSIALDREKSLVARAARTREIVAIGDTSLEPDFMPNPLLPETHSEVAVPLVAGDKVLGVLDVQDSRIHRFTPADLNVFSTLAGQISTALQNASLFGQVEENLAETRVRFEVSQALASAQTEDEVLDAMIQVADFYPETQVSILLIDPDADELTLTQSRNLIPEGEAPGREPALPQGSRFAAAHFPLIQHISLDTPFVSPNILLDERIDPATREIISMSGAASTVLLPITVGSEWLGIIAASHHQEGFFNERRLYLYQSLAQQGATALRTARLYDETQRTAERLREVDRLKSEFLANMSHELRTPLNSILGYTELILMDLEDELDSETLEDIQAIHNNGQHLLTIINDILDLAKIEAGRMTLNLEEVLIEPLLEGVKNSNAGLVVKKSIDLKIEVEDDLPPLQADPVRLHQILNNLVSNAVKFTDEGYVSLHAFTDNGWVCIQIKDTGVGINEEDLESIFDKFRQVDGSFTRRAAGTGLGLSITRHLVQMHGGRINVHSQPGQGSTFTVRLPVQRQGADNSKDGRPKTIDRQKEGEISQ